MKEAGKEGNVVLNFFWREGLVGKIEKLQFTFPLIFQAAKIEFCQIPLVSLLGIHLDESR